MDEKRSWRNWEWWVTSVDGVPHHVPAVFPLFAVAVGYLLWIWVF